MRTQVSSAQNEYWVVNKKRQSGYSRQIVNLFPLWLRANDTPHAPQLLGGSEDAFVREVTFVDPVTKRTTITSTNMSMSQYVTCLERIQYTPEPSRPAEKTLFTQTAEIQTRMAIWQSVANKLEAWSCERFGDNARLGRIGFENVLRNLWENRDMRQVEH